MKDDGYPAKLDPKSEPFQVAVHDLRRIIRNEILKLLTRLFYSPGLFELYRNYTGGIDYKAFQQELLQSLEAERAKEDIGDESKLPFIFRAFSEIVSEIGSPEIHQLNSQQEQNDNFPEIYHLIGYPSYSPPSKWIDIVNHLVCLYISWDLQYKHPKSFENLIPFSDMLLLLSFAKLMGASYELLANYTMKGERELTRTKKSTEAKKKETNKRKIFVMAIYQHGKPIKPGTKSSKVFTAIERQFRDWQGKEGPWGTIPKDMRIPSRDSIKRWLSEAGILNCDFNNDGNYLIKQT